MGRDQDLDDGDELDRLVAAALRRWDQLEGLRRLAERDVDPHRLLRELASLQDGQFATAQAGALGLSRHALAWLDAAGRTRTVRRGVRRFTPVPGVPDVAVTAWLTCWPDAVISHGSAAIHHGFDLGAPRWAPQPATITVPASSRRAPAGIVVHRTRQLPIEDRLRVGGIRYTTLARTVCDLAAVDGHVGVLQRVDDAVALGASRAWLHRVSGRLSAGREGVALVHRATGPSADEFRSWLERHTSSVFAAGGVPAPSWNQPIRDRRGRIGVADCLWPPDAVVELLRSALPHHAVAAPAGRPALQPGAGGRLPGTTLHLAGRRRAAGRGGGVHAAAPARGETPPGLSGLQPSATRARGRPGRGGVEGSAGVGRRGCSTPWVGADGVEGSAGVGRRDAPRPAVAGPRKGRPGRVRRVPSHRTWRTAHSPPPEIAP